MNDAFLKKLNFQKEFAVNTFGILIILLTLFEEVLFINLKLIKIILLLNFLVMWNIKKIPKKNLFLRFLRAISYNIIFVVVSFFYIHEINVHGNYVVLGYIIVTVISLLFYIINLKKYRFMYSSGFLGINHIDGIECFAQILTLIM